MMLFPWLALQPAAAAPDPVQVALASVSEPFALALVGAVPLGGAAGPDGYGPRGVAVQLAPQLEGLPVDALRIVRLDATGRVVAITGDPVPPVAFQGPGHTLSLGEAQALAAALVGGTEIGARLSWQAVRGTLRRVWTVERTGGSPRGHQVPQVRIDAVTGQVLSVTEGAIDAAPTAPPRAPVYVNNPVVDSDTVEVTLPLASVSLSDDRMTVLQCRDLGETQLRTALGGVEHALHVCTRVDAAGPVDGHYRYEPVPYPADPARDEDDFVAANVYWNTHRGLDWFEDLGWVPNATFDPRMDVVVNYRVTDLWSEASATDPTQPLAPYRNAYFTGGYETSQGDWVTPTLVYGQGPDTDFGYDADVVHHELGHLIVRSVSGPSWSPDGPHGPSVRARALNEAFADYFSSAIQGDPLVSEYVKGDGTAIRDLEGPETCGASLYGEPHYDSLPFSIALWRTRSTLPPADRPLFDQAVLDSLSIMGINADFPDAAAAVEVLVDERLGAAAHDALWEAFEARGVHTCPPVNEVAVGPEPFRRFSLVDGAWWWTGGLVPGLIQYRVEVPGGTVVRLSFEQAEYLGFDPFVSPPEPLGVVGRAGAEPILWSQEEATSPYTTTGGSVFDVVLDAWVTDATDLGEAVRVDSAPNPEDERYLMHRYELTWTVEASGPYVFQLTNAHPRSATAYDLTVTFDPLPGDSTAGTDTEPTPPEPEAEPVSGDAPRGCGCTAGAGAPHLALLAMGLLLAGRRRVSSGGDGRPFSGKP